VLSSVLCYLSWAIAPNARMMGLERCSVWGGEGRDAVFRPKVAQPINPRAPQGVRTTVCFHCVPEFCT
jgi:hypothetical protein